MVIVWGIIDATLIYSIYKKESYKKIQLLRVELKKTIKSLSRVEQFFIGFSIFILAGILVQGLVYPTNNWDSMAYHMARIVHWIQNESLAHYRTSIYPQLNSAPFAEELILNVNLLFGNDYLSNSIQWFYTLGSIVAISLVAKGLGLNRFGQLFSAFILVCIPEIILLGSSTHNETVLSFFMLMSIYYFIRIVSEKTVINFLFLGLSLGLATATKHTAYLYLMPFVAIFSGYIIYYLILKKERFLLPYCSLLICGFVVVNAGHYTRNYQLSSSIFGVDDTLHESYVNQEHSLKMMVSNVSRNLSCQAGVPYVTQVVYNLTVTLHDLINEDINNPKTTYDFYAIDSLATYEDNGANIFHMVLILLSMVWMIVTIKRHDLKLKLFWIACVLSFLLFCFYLKWVPYVKLHTPFFVFYSVVLAYFLIKIFNQNILRYLCVLGFVIYAIAILTFNRTRPFITYPPFTWDIKMDDDRYKKYFSKSVVFYHDYKKVKDMITFKKLKNIGLKLGPYSMEYQLFSDVYRSDIRAIHLKSHKICEKLEVESPIDCIVSTDKHDFIDYEGKRYLNVTRENEGYLCLYLME